MTPLAALYNIVWVVAAPDPGAGSAPPGSGNFLKILGWAKWVASGIGVLGLILVGAAMAISHRRGTGGEHGSAFGWVLAGCLLIASAAPIVTAMGI